MANETGAYFFLINGPEIMSKLAGEPLICSAARSAWLTAKLVVNHYSRDLHDASPQSRCGTSFAGSASIIYSGL